MEYLVLRGDRNTGNNHSCPAPLLWRSKKLIDFNFRFVHNFYEQTR